MIKPFKKSKNKSKFHQSLALLFCVATLGNPSSLAVESPETEENILFSINSVETSIPTFSQMLFSRDIPYFGLMYDSSLGYIFNHFQENPSLPTEELLTQTQEESEEYRAMWISYLELADRNLSTKDSFIREMTTMFSECKSLGLNRVIVHVRPMGDALYPSDIYPWSHFLTGTQGVNPGFDPLAEMITIAHDMNLKFEAWINPYRAKLNTNLPATLSYNNLANQSYLTFSVNNGIYYNPALAEVQQMVVDGVREIVENYDVDGIHFDDYFYPTTDSSVDYAQYIQSGTYLSQEDWRRENVNTLVKAVYETVKSIDDSVDFGISPQGNNDNNYNTQYSDVNLWLSTEGYVDYVTPQLYWGFNYLTSAGRADYQYLTILNTWNSYPRHENVELYVGLGAYRIGVGDSSSSTYYEWNSGANLSNMIAVTHEMDDINGYTLFRHDFLFNNSSYSYLAEQEKTAILALYQ